MLDQIPEEIQAQIHADDGYRPNVGIILTNELNQVFWARRAGHDGWQFPQGGVKQDETVDQAMYRELYEEVGLERRHVRVMARTSDWLKYDLPQRYLRRIRRRGDDKFRGQKQIWYLLRLLGDEQAVRLDRSVRPEFDKWIWVDWWTAAQEIVEFKRSVYEHVLTEFYKALPPFYSAGPPSSSR